MKKLFQVSSVCRGLTFLALLGFLNVTASTSAGEAEPEVTGIKAVCRNGQTFITWSDVAEGEEAARFFYALYRSDKPITQKSLAAAECVQRDIFYNSARQFGYAFSEKSRLDPAKPMVVLEDGGQPLPMWSGVTAVTVQSDGTSYYAVVATDKAGAVLTKVVPGKSATTEPVAEKVAPLKPIKVRESPTPLSGVRRLPLYLDLHSSNSGRTEDKIAAGESFYVASRAGDCDYYLYFARPEWGYRDGLQGVFAVLERRGTLVLVSRDCIERPLGNPLNFTMETFWFGYYCVPQWSPEKEPRAYPFTERRMLWVIDWTVKKYDADPDRIYAGGGSMGAWGLSTFAFRHPEIFAAIYPDRPRTRQKGLPSLTTRKVYCTDGPVLMDDGKTDYFLRMDMVKFASEHHEDLPFMGWNCGRADGFASWQEEVDMVKAMAAAHHGFAFSWNNGNHGEGAASRGLVNKYYGPGTFARNRSYPAFSNSSIDNNMGSGDAKEGDLVGGINLGFAWKNVVDEAGKWSAAISNDLAKAEMTVDVTPRYCQKFKAKPSEKFKWTNSAGGAGEVAADQWGLVTIEKVRIKPGEATTLAISR